jgi:putative peptide zinc metalloprotease protein
MTDLLEREDPDVAPRLGDGVELLGEYQSSGFLEQKFLLRRPDDQVVQVSHLLYLVASKLDGRRHVDAIAHEVSQEFGRGVSAANVAFLLEQRLEPLGLLQLREGESGPPPRATPLFALGLKAAFFPAGLVHAATRPLLFLFRRPVVCIVLAGLLAVDVWLLFIHGLTAAALQVLVNPLLVAVLLGVGIISGIWHELGHSTACRYGGASPGRIGVGVFLIWPVFYSDVTDTYRLGRTGRLRTDLGGVYFNAVGVLVLAGLYAVTGFEPLLIVIVFEQLEILQQGFPFLRLDGYYVVSDLVGVPDLFGRIRPILKSLVPGAVPGPKVTELRPRVRVVVTAWVAVTTVLIGGLLVFFVVNLPAWVRAGTASFSFRTSEMSRTLSEGDYLGTALSTVQAAMLLVPALGMGLMASKLLKLRRTVQAERATASSGQSPQGGTEEALAPAPPWTSSTAAGRGLAVLIGIAAALGLAVALVQAPWVYALMVPAVFSLGVLWAVLRWTATNEPGDRVVARWTYAAYVLHLAVSLGISASGQAARIFGAAADAPHLSALAILRHWSEGTTLPTFAPGEAGLSYGLARLYQLVGSHQVAGLALISLCSALAVALVADTTRRLFGSRARLAVLPLLVLLPGLLVWTSQLSREAPVLVGLALAANLAVRLSEQMRLGRLVMLGATVAALFALRPTIAYVAAAGLLVGLVLGGRHVAAGVATAAMLAGVVAVLALGGAVGGSGYERTAAVQLAETPRSNPGAAPAPDASTTSADVADLPSALPQFLLGPGSPQANSVRRGLGVVEAFSLWCLVPFVVLGLSRARRLIGRRAAFLLAPAIALTLALTLLMGGSETLTPDRLQVLVLLLPFAGLGRVRRIRPTTSSTTPNEAGPALAAVAPHRELQPVSLSH